MSRRSAVTSLALALSAGLLIGSARLVHAQQSTVDFTISGTSTIRGWTCNAKGTMAVTRGSGAAAPGFPNGVQTATVTVPLKQFQCPNEEMTQHLNDAMKSDKFSEVVFKLEKYTMAGTQATASGTLTVTGVTQPVEFPIAIKESPQGVEVSGNTRLDMTKFGVDPPVVMLGMLKVGPQIRLEFKGLVGK